MVEVDNKKVEQVTRNFLQQHHTFTTSK